LGLVLGAGGTFGAAWMIGARCALERVTGCDVLTADVVIDVGSGRHLGNFPQDFSHFAPIQAAAPIILAVTLVGSHDLTEVRAQRH
jgi:hypothetical protein